MFHAPQSLIPAVFSSPTSLPAPTLFSIFILRLRILCPPFPLCLFPSATLCSHLPRLLLQPVLVEEPSPEECLQLLQGLAPRYEAYHGVSISAPALAAAVAAAQRCATAGATRKRCVPHQLI
jgi:AAA lid domain